MTSRLPPPRLSSSSRSGSSGSNDSNNDKDDNSSHATASYSSYSSSGSSRVNDGTARAINDTTQSSGAFTGDVDVSVRSAWTEASQANQVQGLNEIADSRDFTGESDLYDSYTDSDVSNDSKEHSEVRNGDKEVPEDKIDQENQSPWSRVESQLELNKDSGFFSSEAVAVTEPLSAPRSLGAIPSYERLSRIAFQDPPAPPPIVTKHPSSSRSSLPSPLPPVASARSTSSLSAALEAAANAAASASAERDVARADYASLAAIAASRETEAQQAQSRAIEAERALLDRGVEFEAELERMKKRMERAESNLAQLAAEKGWSDVLALYELDLAAAQQSAMDADRRAGQALASAAKISRASGARVMRTELEGALRRAKAAETRAATAEKAARASVLAQKRAVAVAEGAVAKRAIKTRRSSGKEVEELNKKVESLQRELKEAREAAAGSRREAMSWRKKAESRRSGPGGMDEESKALVASIEGARAQLEGMLARLGRPKPGSALALAERALGSAIRGLEEGAWRERELMRLVVEAEEKAEAAQGKIKELAGVIGLEE